MRKTKGEMRLANSTTLEAELQTLIRSEINNVAFPIRCKIRKIYDDNLHVDAETEIGVLQYVETIGSNLAIGNQGVLVFLNGNVEDYIVITR